MEQGNLYSFVWDFRGGTFVKQICASSHEKAFLEWINYLEEKGEEVAFTKQECTLLRTQIDFEINIPILLNNTKNAWSNYLTFFEEPIWLTIIKTCSD